MAAMKVQSGFVHFELLKFREAMRDFTLSKIDPREIIAYLPHCLGSLSSTMR